MWFARFHMGKRSLVQSILSGAVLALVAGCSGDSEAKMRAKLEQWFYLGDTVTFSSGVTCTAAAFRLTKPQIKAGIVVVGRNEEVPQVLQNRGVVALNDTSQTPDAAMVALANSHRPIGMGMRRSGLEARDCMDEFIESAFSYALKNPKTLIAWEAETGMMMLADPSTGVLVVTIGAG